MATGNSNLLDTLSKLTINYAQDDIASEYRKKLSADCNVNDGYINYKPENGEAIHFVLNIKVSDKSTFIPFIFGVGTIEGRAVDDLAKEILSREKEIRYNFSEFIINDLEGQSCVSIKTKRENGTMSVEEVKHYSTKENGKLWFNTLETFEEKKAAVNKCLCNREDGCRTFAEVFADVYPVSELYFRFISIDSNYARSGSLSQIMVVSPNDADINRFLEQNFEKIREIISLIRSRYVYDLLAKNKYEATKSAKAAIMSRNMSHNIGSHVMSYLKQKLGSITAIMNDENKVLYNLTDDEYLKGLIECRELGNPKVLQTAIQNTPQPSTSKKIEFPFLVGTGRFIGYLQERQDYIATIATDYIPYGAPVNLKDAIYDELNPDLRHMRHNESSQDDDGNRPMNVLLSFIAKSEGLSRENMEMVGGQSFKTHNDILFGFSKYENEGAAPHVFGIEPENSKSQDVALTEMRKVNFSLPGGLVGRQAIFSIVENIIRNAAKHGNPRSTKQIDGKEIGNLELSFDVIDLSCLDKEKCIDDRICDPQWRELYKASIDHEQLYLFTITDNIVYKTDSEGRKLADRMRPALIEEYLDDSGNMRPTNKGIKEIRISAAWMRNEVDETRYLRYEDYAADKPIPQKKAPLVAIEMTKEDHLRYMICLPQDRLAAVITDGMSNDNKKLFEGLSERFSKDWTVYGSIEDAKKDGKISYHYIFVADEEKYNEFRPYTSNRLFVWNPTDEQQQELTRLQEGKGTDVEVWYKDVKNAIVRMVHGVNDQSEPIYIWDSKTVDSQSEEDKNNRPDKVIVERLDKDADKAQYVYRTHHSTDTQFEAYWKKKSLNEAYNSIVRIDAITGDNSSDRIVRREPLNEEWYCSHLRALKKRVAIFDERLFKIVHNVDEEGFVVNNSSVDPDLVNSLIARLEGGEDLEKIKKEIIEQKLFGYETEDKIMFDEDYQSAEKLLEKLKGKLVSFNPKLEKNHKSIVYQEKGVDVFSIIKERTGAFAIVGYVGNETDENGILQATKYDKIATITSSKDSGFNVKIEFQYLEFAKQYDYISIHQGILDKIYEEFGIKEHGEENDPKKCHVTKRLHEEFIKEEYKPIPTYAKEKNGETKRGEDFLPCFIIHSGRAKPTKNDMPQELPFVQYAAIEHGVLDCKYSLVELLDYARYES